MFPHGGRGVETTVLQRFNNAKHKEGTGYLKVGPGSPCPVLQHPNMFYNNQSMFPNSQNMFPHGGRGTEATVLLRFNNAKHKEGAGYLKVGPGSPCPVLQQPICSPIT